MMRCSLLIALGLLTCIVPQTAMPASPEAVASQQSASLSRIKFEATLSVAEIRDKLRQAAAAAFRKSPPKPVSGERDGVRVTVTPRVLANRLGLSARADGKLHVSVPIKISVKVDKAWYAKTVGVKGCEPRTFTVGARFDPRILSTGGVQFALAGVSVRPANYECGLFWIVQLDDVAARIVKRLKALGKAAFNTRLRELNALLPRESELLGMLRQPADFGGAVTLGIDSPRLQVRRIGHRGGLLRVSGFIEGRPRLVFGDDWAARESAAAGTATEWGFSLPARLLFPTDPALLPHTSLQQASGCLGSFRLHPVPGRQDLAVLQRCDRKAGSNVIWLSGASQVPPRNVRRFDRSLSNVLTEIVDWLDDPSLWRGVAGISTLRQEVDEFRGLLQLFQAETRIPVDDRGQLRFFDLNMNLIGVWVDDVAIHADVMLTGKAQLDMRLSL